MRYRPPESDTDRDTDAAGRLEDASTSASIIEERRLRGKPPRPTDFASLRKGWEDDKPRYQRPGFTEYLIAFVTPLLIFVMVGSVLMFLLDVRYVYTEVHNTNLRYVALFFIMGVVALNRLVARDGGEESCLYILGLGAAITLYTLGTTTLYEMGSVAGTFLDKPYIAVVFNLSVVSFLWWVTNRLTHECCVDENPMAGDVGILTGTALRLRQAMQEGLKRPAQKPDLSYLPFDPSEWREPEKQGPARPIGADQRLPKRHPGISVLYFSIPVMLIFALGVRVVPHGGRWMLIMGYAWLLCYTVSALMLLMLTSLAQLRMYFRSRHIPIPEGIAPFWIGLGTFFLLVVVFGAAAMPNRGMPPLAHIESHEIDFWTRTSTFRPIEVEVSAEDLAKQTNVVRIIGRCVLAGLGLFFGYALLKGLGAFAVRMAREHYRLPRFLARFFAWLDRFLQRITSLPPMPHLPRRRRIDRALSVSIKYRNPLADPVRSQRMSAGDQVAYAYEALRALAEDMGVPARPDQTPYEFIHEFPKQLITVKEEAAELTELYVASAFAARQLGEETLDRLRKFWIAYERARRRVVR